MQRSQRLLDSGELPINPVSFGDGEWTSTGLWLHGGTLYVAGILGLQVFIEYMASKRPWSLRGSRALGAALLGLQPACTGCVLQVATGVDKCATF